jgi:hypothetical protein
MLNIMLGVIVFPNAILLYSQMLYTHTHTNAHIQLEYYQKLSGHLRK